MFTITTVPVTIGLYVNKKFNNFSMLFLQVANKISTILFIIIVLGALASEWNTFTNNLNLLGPSIILLILSMLFIGFNSSKWFCLDKEKAITIAIESSIQNATVGITIGNIIFPQESGLSIFSLPSGVYGILMYLVCLPFMLYVIKN